MSSGSVGGSVGLSVMVWWGGVLSWLVRVSGGSQWGGSTSVAVVVAAVVGGVVGAGCEASLASVLSGCCGVSHGGVASLVDGGVGLVVAGS